MRKKLTAILTAFLVMWYNGVAFGGEMPQAADIERIKQAIRTLEEVGKDPNTPADVKESNRKSLEHLRGKLEAALNSALTYWRNGLEFVRVVLDENQRAEAEVKVKKRMSELEKDLEQLKEDKKASPGSTAATPPAGDDGVKLAPFSLTPTPNRNIEVKDCAEEMTNPELYSLYEKYICQIARRIKRRKTVGEEAIGPIAMRPDPKATIIGTDDFSIALALIAKLNPPDYLVKAEEARTDKQVGAGPAAGGTTSLVVKGSVPTILGLAVENGALTRSVSESTVTFRGNPVGIIQALANRGYLQSYEEVENNGFLRLLKPLSFSFSFDTSRGIDQMDAGTGSMPPPMNVFTGDRQQLSQVTARYEFINRRDPRHKIYRRQWEKFLEAEAQALNEKVKGFFSRLLREPDLQAWRSQTEAVLRETTADDVERVVKARFAELSPSNLRPETIEILKSLDQTFERYLVARKNLLDRIAKGTIVAFEYTNTRNVDAPNLSNFRLIAEKGPGGNLDLTFNGSLTIFDKLPMGASGRVRDFQFATQIDYRAGNPFGSGDLIFFASGRYERLMENAVAPNGMAVMDTKGDIAIGQIGLKIPLRGTGFRIPVSFSVANRTELIKEKEVRGNIGITFDLDALFSSVKP